MPPQDKLRPLPLRALLESTGTPFAISDYEPGAAIFLQGDDCDSVMHIEDGRVRLAVTTPSGKEAICGLLEAGDLLGEEALAGRDVRRHTAIALTATTVIVVTQTQMIQLLHTQPSVLDRVVAHVVERHTRLESALTDQLLNSVERRLAHTLLALAGCDERRPCRCALPHVSQEIIAEMVGTTRSRVNVFMGKFKKLGFIEEGDSALKVQPSLLQVVHGRRGVSNGTSEALSGR